MKKTIPFHPFLFALYPILFLYAENIRETPFSSIFNSTLVVLGITVFLFLLIYKSLNNAEKAGIVISLFVLLVFIYGHVYAIIRSGFFNHGVLLSVWGIVFMTGLFFIIKADKKITKLTKILNVAAISLIVITLFNITYYKITTKDYWQDVKSSDMAKAINVNSKNPEILPNIYYIIFDRYADNKTLKDYYNYDNTEFTDYLKEKGFYVAEESRSNYLVTAHSLASSMNMEHLQYFTEELGEDCDNWLPLYWTLRGEYKIWAFLKSKGYTYIHSGSWWPLTNKNDTADVNINLYTSSDFSILLYSKTVFFPITTKLGLKTKVFRGLSKNHYIFDTTLNQIENLMSVPDLENPTYTFVHFLIPHAPYIFDKDGNFQSEEDSKEENYREDYRGQLTFTNKKIKEFIDQILAKSEVRPIIILQADEGPYPERWHGETGHDLTWIDEPDEGLRLKTGIFNALYLPDVDTSDLYPTITPVNTFRYIFNKYFGAEFELLPDKIYAHYDYRFPYKFFDITDRIQEEKNILEP